ncbi:hypothetical protein [Myxococcus sp. MxC21-1]|uniref:hypothetical protein n=1 Tax=Myxococcus sp. MxC21-1 TaxID=3041439 RepID=UPI003977265E
MRSVSPAAPGPTSRPSSSAAKKPAFSSTCRAVMSGGTLLRFLRRAAFSLRSHRASSRCALVRSWMSGALRT